MLGRDNLGTSDDHQIHEIEDHREGCQFSRVRGQNRGAHGIEYLLESQGEQVWRQERAGKGNRTGRQFAAFISQT